MTTTLSATPAVPVTTPVTNRHPNPFRERLRQRQAAMGGKHAPSVVGGHLFDAEEVAVAMARETKALRDEFVSPF